MILIKKNMILEISDITKKVIKKQKTMKNRFYF